MAGPEHRLNLLLVFRQGDDQRALAIGGEAIALVGRGVFGVPEQRMRGQHRLQRGDDLRLAFGAQEHGRISGSIH
jgi:hypothetical protein